MLLPPWLDNLIGEESSAGGAPSGHASRDSQGCRSSGRRPSKRRVKVCLVEALEVRMFLSVSPMPSIGWNGDTSAWYQSGAVLPGDVSPTGTSYMLYDHWGGTWCDAEKRPPDDTDGSAPGTGDDYLCWAASCSNVLTWTGWGVVSGMTNTDQVFQYYQDHFTDVGGWMEWGLQWWFDGTFPTGTGGAENDVPGGGFYPNEDFASHFHSIGYDQRAQALTAIDDYLHAGYGITIGIAGPGGHAITVWGIDYNPSNPDQYYGIWVTDSDDAKHLTDAPDQLRYYQVALQNGSWYLQNYYGTNDWYIDEVDGLESKSPTPVPEGGQIQGVVWNDATRDGIRQAGESPIQDRTVFLDVNNNGTLDTPVFTQNTSRAILDSATVTSTLLVDGVSMIGDLNVRLNISHSYDSDLIVNLVSPSGTRVQLLADVGESGDGFINTVLDDEAAGELSGGSAPFTGTFRPSGSLGLFDGENANGTWTLEITDQWDQDTGVLNSWSLEFSEPAARTAADGTYAFAGLAAGTYHVRLEVPQGWLATNPSDGEQTVAVQEAATVQNVNFGLSDNPATELGAVDYLALSHLDPSSGELWYRLQATHNATLTVQTVGLSEGVLLGLYDANFASLATSNVLDGVQRLDRTVTAGTVLYVKVSGSAGDVDLKIANLVSRVGTGVTVYGSAGDDRFEFTAGALHQVNINDIHYRFSSAGVNRVTFQGSGGVDWAMLVGSSDLDTAEMYPNSAVLTGTGYTARVTGTRDITINSGGGANDVVRLYDSAGSDTFHATPTYGDMVGDLFFCRAEGFATLHGFASGGVDTAYLYGSAGNDTFEATPVVARLYGTGFYNRMKDFEYVHAFDCGGSDVAHFYDSAGDDLFEAKLGSWTRMSGTGFYRRAVGFKTSNAHGGSGGVDQALLYDSPGNDLFSASPTQASFTGSNYTVLVQAFAKVQAYRTLGGADQATLTDSSGVDTFWASPTKAYLSGTGFYNEVNGFQKVRADSTAGGADVAYLYDSAGNDTLIATSTYAKLYGENFWNAAMAFRYAHAFASGGVDTATLLDSAGDDTFVGMLGCSRMYGANYSNRAKDFDTVIASSKYGGNDKAYLYDSAASDHLSVDGRQAALSYAASQVQALNFPWLQAISQSGGSDTRHLSAVDLVLQFQGMWTDI